MCFFFFAAAIEHKRLSHLNQHAYPTATINDGIKYKNEIIATVAAHTYTHIIPNSAPATTCMCLSFVINENGNSRERVYGVGSLIYFISVINVLCERAAPAMMISNNRIQV